MQMAEGGDEEHKHPVSPAVTDPFTGFFAIPQPYSQNDLGVERGNWHDALQSLEAIDMLPATPTFLVTSHVTHLSSVALKLALALLNLP